MHTMNKIFDQIDAAILWCKKLFNKPGQRFCNGEIVTHKSGWRAKVIKCRCYQNNWEYEVFYGGRGMTVFDCWEDHEIQ